MKADEPDAVQRWQSISSWYSEFASMTHWDFLLPMVGLTAWVSGQPFAAALYPGTSHEWLCVHLQPGYHPDQPFLSCGVRPDGQFECELWAQVGRSRERKVASLDQDCALFKEFAGKLMASKGAAGDPSAPTDQPGD